jgi:tetratricopeptide (TPR) repeat protein
MGTLFFPRARSILRCVSLAFALMLLSVMAAGRARAQSDPDDPMRAKIRQCAKADGAEQCRAALPVCKEMLDAARRGQPLTRSVLAELLGKIGSCHQDLDQHAEAEAYYREHVQVVVRELGERHADHARALHDLSLSLRELGKLEEAEQLLRQAVKLNESLKDQDDDEKKAALKSLERVLAERKDQAEAIQELGRTAGPVLFQSLRQCRRAKTPQACTASLPACRSYAAAAEKKLGTLALKRAEVGKHIADCHVQLDQFSQAEAELRRVIELLKAKVGERDQRYIASLANLGFVLMSMGRHAEGEALSRAALALEKAVSGERSAQYARILNNLAEALIAQKKHAEAEAVLRQALSLTQEAGSEDAGARGRGRRGPARAAAPEYVGVAAHAGRLVPAGARPVPPGRGFVPPRSGNP